MRATLAVISAGLRSNSGRLRAGRAAARRRARTTGIANGFIPPVEFLAAFV